MGVIRVPATRVRYGCLTQAAGLASPPDAIPNGLQFCCWCWYYCCCCCRSLVAWAWAGAFRFFAFASPVLILFTSRQVTVPPRTIPLPCSISSPFLPQFHSSSYSSGYLDSLSQPLCSKRPRTPFLSPRPRIPRLPSVHATPPSNLILRQSNKLVIIITGTRISYLPHDSAPL